MEEFERREERRDGGVVGQVKREGESRLILMLMLVADVNMDIDVNFDVDINVGADEARWGDGDWSWSSEEGGGGQVVQNMLISMLLLMRHDMIPGDISAFCIVFKRCWCSGSVYGKRC